MFLGRNMLFTTGKRQQALHLCKVLLQNISRVLQPATNWMVNKGKQHWAIFWAYKTSVSVPTLEHQKDTFIYFFFFFFPSITRSQVVYVKMQANIWYLPTAIPGSELAVCTSSLPWWRITQLGSIWAVPLGSRGTIWNFLKSVSLMALFSGHTS